MKFILFFGLLFTAVCVNAQNSETVLPLAKYRITKADGKIATNAGLIKSKPVMLIYFATDCSHCEHLMDELRPKMNSLKKMQVVMITFSQTEYPFLRMLSDFNKKFNLSKYPNFTVGTEYDHYHPKDYPVQFYYGIFNTPYVVVYNAKGKVVKSFTTVPKVEDLLAAVKKA